MATDEEIGKAEDALKWITNLEAPIDNFANKKSTAVKELGKATSANHKDILSDVKQLAKYASDLAAKGKEAKKGGEKLLKKYKEMKAGKVTYAKFKSDAVTKNPFNSVHVAASDYVELYDNLVSEDKNDFVKTFSGGMVKAMYNSATLYEATYKKFLVDLRKL